MRKSRLLLLGAMLASVFLSIEASAQVNDQSLDRYKEQHPRARFYGNQFYTNEGTSDEAGTTTMIYGTALSFGATPLESAWNHVHEVQDFLGDEIGILIPEVNSDGNVILGAMYDRGTDTYKLSTFRFSQVYEDIPVFRSGVGFLTRNEQGNPLVMATFDVKDLTGVDVSGAQDGQITLQMIRSVDNMMNGKGAGAQGAMRSVMQRKRLPATEVSEEELVIWAGANQMTADPELAMKFVATRGSIRTTPEDFQKHLVLASVATGKILYSETMVHDFVDVTGTVTGRATQGLNALECDPEVEIPLPYIEANVVGGNTTFADENGQFVIPHGGSSQVTVRSRLRGLYFEVFDDTAGQSIPQVTTLVTPPGPANLVHNPSANQEFPTANVNAYVEANRVRDFTLSFAPNYPTIGNQQFFDLIVNENSFSGITSCNAVYTGSSLVFWRNSGGCNNTSFSDVVHHEYGHHLIQVTGNGQGQLGEGSGDCMGVLIQDDPILGQGFSTCNQGIRNANNNMQYPCNGGIHSCGQLISGCVWSLRNELIVTEPVNYRDIGASLFINMMIVRGQMLPGNSTIDPQITIIYLELDDDDSDIGNGTPHYQEIAAGFGDHNMDAPALDLLSISYPNGRPEFVNPAGGVEFTVVASALLENPVPGTGVLHVSNGGAFQDYPMNETSPNVYEANFPATNCGTEVSYYISVQTANNQTQFDPTDAPGVSFKALSAESVVITFEDDFQTNTGWTVSGNAGDGQWNRGVPNGGGVRGDPAADGDGSGSCYVTDNVEGNSDVDDGTTTLTSPTLDATTSGNDIAVISYHRWYHNTFGNSPASDIFVVEISNNNGSTWTNLETVGPSGPEVSGGWIQKSFKISDFVTPTSQMRLRFHASDLSDPSVVEAGVDGVQVQIVSCDTPSITPVSIDVTLGSIDSGGVTEVEESDDIYLIVDPEFLDFRYQTEFTVDAVSTVQTPSSFEFTYESRVLNFVGTVEQELELFNFDSGQFESVDNRLTSPADSVVNVVPGGDLSRFVEAGTMAIRARVSYENSLAFWVFNTDNLYLPYKVRVDQILWTISD